MTIASCLVLPEGVVFGVDSTTSTQIEEIGLHYLNHNQKLFEIGKDSTLAVMTWGLSFLRDTSYRTLIALLDDDFKKNEPKSVREAAERWRDMVSEAYKKAFKSELDEYEEIIERQKVSAQNLSDEKSDIDDKRLLQLQDELFVGFCVGGYCLPDRTPSAHHFEIKPDLLSPATVYSVYGGEIFRGQPTYFQRLYDGFDIDARDAIFDAKDNGSSKKLWQGSKEKLNVILQKQSLYYPELTIRDGIDFVHFSIYATIKAMKFSTRGQVCGGPIELAVITTDRKFRWVEHKEFKSAIGYDGA